MISQNNSDLHEEGFNPSGSILDSILDRIHFQKQATEEFCVESRFNKVAGVSAASLLNHD